jgi:hypothetical protein
MDYKIGTTVGHNIFFRLHLHFPVVQPLRQCNEYALDHHTQKAPVRLFSHLFLDNIIIPVPRVDRGPIDCKNIRGIIVDKDVNGYKIGTTVG